MSKGKFSVVILAAGLGKRMDSPMQKVLHKLRGKSMIARVVDATRALGPENILVIVGYQKEQVIRELSGTGAVFLEQAAPRGTGDAVGQAAPLLDDYPHDVLVMCGDTPLLRPETLARMLAAHRAARPAATVMTTRLTRPSGYGRIKRNGSGEVEKIVEESDASDEERLISEINSGVYLFNAPKLFANLALVSPDNVKGEYYLTDVIRILRSRGERVAAFPAEHPEEVLGINTPGEMARARKLLKSSAENG